MNRSVIGSGITLEVGRAEPTDPALAALSELAREEVFGADSNGTPPRGVETYLWLASLATRDTGATVTGILASLNGGAVGMGIVVEDGDSALLHSVFVAPAFRGIGVGRAIVLEAHSLAGESMLRTLALPGDRRTKNLFEQAGMPAQLIVAG